MESANIELIPNLEVQSRIEDLIGQLATTAKNSQDLIDQFNQLVCGCWILLGLKDSKSCCVRKPVLKRHKKNKYGSKVFVFDGDQSICRLTSVMEVRQVFFIKKKDDCKMMLVF